MLKKFVRLFGGDPNKREIDKFSVLVDQINALEAEFEALSDEALKAKTVEFRKILAVPVHPDDTDEDLKRIERETLDELLPMAFAAVREASKRTIGLRHFDVQLIGGAILHQSTIAEMRTGEGKTLVATLPLYLNSLTGKGVHLVTVNDYLARRDARWMAPIFAALGMSVGVLQMAARTENGKKAFIVDLEKRSPHEDQDQLRMVPRQEAYQADIIYGTNSEFGFDYLRDNMVMQAADRVQRGHYYSIVDEVDNVLIDEARTPLIISGPAQDEASEYYRMAQVIKALRPEDYEVNEKDHAVSLTEIGETHIEEVMGEPLHDPDRPEDVTPRQARMLGYIEQAMRAQFLFHRNKDYLVQAGKVVIVDEFTGRLMPGRRWSDGLHQAVEAKEGVKVESESVTYATITIQNYFRMYDKLAGMSGTALTEAEEFDKIYKLNVVAIPTNLEYQAMKTSSGLVDVESRDEQGYKFQYYALQDDLTKQPVFWKRKDYPDIVYRTEEAKLRSVAQEILKYHVLGRPLLVGTTSVELSERVSNRLRSEPLRRLCQVILIRRAYFDKNKKEEDGRQIAELQFLNGSLSEIDISEMRKLAREFGIQLNPEDSTNLNRLLTLFGLKPGDKDRLLSDLQGGIPHQVLNARKHTEESQIIAEAGAFGAVTIATNMAGRGVDIKLGGNLNEEIISAVNRILRRSVTEDPYLMSQEERRKALLAIDPAEYGIYETQVQAFLSYIENMERVRDLGGLHVIGSERHEARRIDNQLRGRSARQGDPGSSRFYLSMEDELMRLFGGQQADGLMQRLKIDDAIPLEAGVVSRIVEQAQTKVEGSNFDIRKHLLEYDDVLNTQRTTIYSQRNRIFTKEDLSEDVTEMLRTEVNKRIPEALKDPEGPWKLLAWLDQIQPSFPTGIGYYPSYPIKILVDQIVRDNPDVFADSKTGSDHRAALNILCEVGRNSLEAEREHVLQTFVKLFDQAQDNLDVQIVEKKEGLDTFLEGLSLEEEGEQRRTSDLMLDLTNAVHLPLKLSTDQQRSLRTEPQKVGEEIQVQIETILTAHAITRLVGSIERRLEESIEVSINQLALQDWNSIHKALYAAIESTFDKRVSRYLGDGDGSAGQITKDLENVFSRINGPITRDILLQLLLMVPQGTRASFDKKTHRRILFRTTRLTYIYYIAKLMEHVDSEKITSEVLEHLEKAQEATRWTWGYAEFARLSAMKMDELDSAILNPLQEAIGMETFEQNKDKLLSTLSGTIRNEVAYDLGRQALTEIYRQLLLSVIGELWVEYLTQMEALRVSIGLEAYAHQDPLVQYKNRAFGLFQELLGNMRLGVITRMFTFRPRETIRRGEKGEQNPLQPQPELMIVESEDNSAQSEDQLDQSAELDEESESGEYMPGADEISPSPVASVTEKEEVSRKPANTDFKKRRRHRR